MGSIKNARMKRANIEQANMSIYKIFKKLLVLQYR